MATTTEIKPTTRTLDETIEETRNSCDNNITTNHHNNNKLKKSTPNSSTVAAAAASNTNKREQHRQHHRHNRMSDDRENSIDNSIVQQGDKEQHSLNQYEDGAVGVNEDATEPTTTSNDNVVSTSTGTHREGQEAIIDENDDDDNDNHGSKDRVVAVPQPSPPNGAETKPTSNESVTAIDNSVDDDKANTDAVDAVVGDVDSGTVAVVDDTDSKNIHGENDNDETDLRNPLRRIWIVTTAAMPWRTGTAVNPLMCALYLTRGRPKHFVTLVIPWLADVESQQKLFGGHVFHDCSSQEEWIRDFCRTRANCIDEERNLRILFYNSKYHNVLGSIFPSEDICGLIPDEEADVAILEEPEHLNWFRIPSNTTSALKKSNSSPPVGEGVAQGEGSARSTSGTTSPDTSSHGVEVVLGKEPDVKERNHLGWATKFRYVVGILHTNYAAYMGQYGFGTSIIAAPALSLLSSIVVRAYCNRVIRLSAALPPLAPHKEVTSNVHGVRSEFLQPPVLKQSQVNSERTKSPADTADASLIVASDEKLAESSHAAVYFIGKVIWAKGFDKVLEVQEIYRQNTGQYFAFDIYGGGSDEKAIRRAFFGRKGGTSSPPLPRSPSGCESPPSETKELASKVFGSTESLRGLLLHAKHAFNTAVMECSAAAGISEENAETQQGSVQVVASPTSVEARTINASNTTTTNNNNNNNSHPLSVLGDFSGKSVTTGVAVSKAVYKLADKLIKAGTKMTFDTSTDREEKDDEADGNNNKKALVFSPPQSRFEWRRHPIPARFLGVIDHVEIRDIVGHKIFLNMSTTEVLCTTTAEALAMGKFVILPDHPSNEFFFQFPNCLVYDSMEECAEKLQWALERDPEPLLEDHVRAFSWEGATDRLFDAAHMTAEEKKKRNVTDKEDKGVARFHVESMLKGHLLSKFFAGEKSDT